MTSLTKKLTAALLALLAALCLAFGVLLASPRTASAEEAIDAAALNIENGVFNGIKDGFLENGKSYSLVIPGTVTSIAGVPDSSAYGLLGRYSEQIVSIEIPGSVTSIGANAFRNCKNVTKLNYYAVNAKVTATNARNPFSGIGNADIVIGSAASPVRFIQSYLFSGTDIHSATIHINGSTVESFGVGIFADCKKLVSVNFANNANLVKLSSNTFSGCASLSVIAMPTSINEIDANAFSGCSNLTEIVIPSTVNKIGAGAFTGCSGLVEIKNLSSLSIAAAPNGIPGSEGLTKLTHIIGASDASWFSTVSVGSDPFRMYNDGSARYLVRYEGVNESITLPNDTSYNYTIAEGAFKNSRITDIVISKSVAAIEKSAFFGCTFLKSVTFSDMKTGINDIKASVFDGCTALEGIELPASVKKIDAFAFRDCRALIEIKIPADVNNIFSSAFGDCTGLEKVILPDAQAKTVTVDGKAFDGCNSIQFVAPNKASYDQYKGRPAFDGGELVYSINYELHYGNEVKAINGINTDGMPKWEGYAESVWYNDRDFNNNAGSIVDNLLNINTTVILYSRAMEKPKVEDFKVKGVNYTDNGWELNSETLFGDEFTAVYSEYKFVVSEYKDMMWRPIDVQDKNRLTDAGYYSVSVLIANEEEYGQWAEDSATKLDVAVSPAEIDSTALLWAVVSGNGFSALLPDNTITTLYKYDDSDYYYTKKQYNGEEKPENEWKHEETSALGEYETIVKNSYLEYNATAATIELKNIQTYIADDKILSVSYTGNVKTDAGLHSSAATVKTHNNYKLVNHEDYRYRGITVAPGSSANEFVVNKIWYIISSNMNSLLTEDGKAAYYIEGWNYGYQKGAGLSAVTDIARPSLVKGRLDDLVTFSLTRLNLDVNDAAMEPIRFDPKDFERIMNTSMPAGEYLLTATIENYYEDNKLVLAGREQSISFTVEQAKKENLLGEKDTNGNILIKGLLYGKYVIPDNTAVVYADFNEGVAQLGDVKNNILPVLGLKAEQLHPERTGIWEEEIYNNFYKPFTIKYSIGGSNTYYDEFDNEFSNKPSRIGDYTVYYKVSAPGYVDDSNNTSSYYMLYIRGTVKPEVAVTPYTNEHIRLPNSDFYEAIYLDDSDARSKQLRNALGIEAPLNYLEVGAYKLVLKLKPNYEKTARWDLDNNQDNVEIYAVPGYGPEYIYYTLNIVKANNEGKQTPTLASWEWGKYKPETHVPHWATKFGAEYNFYLVSATKTTTDPDSRYYYRPTELQKGFADAPADEYYLIPIAYENKNVKYYEASDSREWGSVTVLKAELTWKTGETPFINSWKYGDDAAGFKLPAGVLDGGFAGLIDEVTVKILLQSDYDKYVNGDDVTTYATIKELQDANGGSVPANNYVYVYYLAGTDNFAEWFYPVSFSVLRATNYWDIAPVVNSWSYGDYTTLIGSFKPHFGDAKAALIEICEIDEDGTRGSMGSVSVLLDGNGQLPMGKYEYRVVLNATANYERLVFENVTFEVFKAENSWETIPGIIGWSEGRFNSSDSGVSNKPVAKARFGTVVYYTVVSDDTGETVIERVAATDIRYADLNKLAVGSYTLIAEVDGDVSYGGLRSETHFAVFEDSVGLAGLIAATMVFAAIALGLAVAGIVLLIRRNRKIEQEFRKMVKTELRRK